MKKREEIEAGLVHVETVVKTVLALGEDSKIFKELATEADAAFDALPAIREAATGNATKVWETWQIKPAMDQSRPKKRWELYKDYHEAWAAHQKDGVCMSVTWAFVGWLYMDFIVCESRLDYLKRCEAVRILKGNGYKELKRLEKEAAKKIGGAK